VIAGANKGAPLPQAPRDCDKFSGSKTTSSLNRIISGSCRRRRSQRTLRREGRSVRVPKRCARNVLANSVTRSREGVPEALLLHNVSSSRWSVACPRPRRRVFASVQQLQLSTAALARSPDGISSCAAKPKSDRRHRMRRTSAETLGACRSSGDWAVGSPLEGRRSPAVCRSVVAPP
jgi:hypothetical protein